MLLHKKCQIKCMNLKYLNTEDASLVILRAIRKKWGTLKEGKSVFSSFKFVLTIVYKKLKKYHCSIQKKYTSHFKPCVCVFCTNFCQILIIDVISCTCWKNITENLSGNFSLHDAQNEREKTTLQHKLIFLYSRNQ